MCRCARLAARGRLHCHLRKVANRDQGDSTTVPPTYRYISVDRRAGAPLVRAETNHDPHVDCRSLGVGAPWAAVGALLSLRIYRQTLQSRRCTY